MSDAVFLFYLAVIATCTILCLFVQSRRIDQLESRLVELTIRQACTYAAHQRLNAEHEVLLGAHNATVQYMVTSVANLSAWQQACNQMFVDNSWTQDGEGWKDGVRPDEEYLEDK